MSATILVADDDPDILSFVTPSLEVAGHRVVEASDGLETLRAVTAHRPDVVLLDIGMPSLDGKAVMRIIRKMGDEAPAVIFLTAHALPLDRVEGFDLGATDYVTKPFDTDELIVRIRSALEMRRLTAQAGG